MIQWPKVIISARVYRENGLSVIMGNHGLCCPSTGDMYRAITLSPELYYAHYMYRGSDHLKAKVTAGWLACRTMEGWQPGMSDHYRRACNIICKNTLITRNLVDWFALSCSGMTGESMQDIRESIEEVDPERFFPQIQLKYTMRYAIHKDAFVLLTEQAIAFSEQYEQKQQEVRSLGAEIDTFRRIMPELFSIHDIEGENKEGSEK